MDATNRPLRVNPEFANYAEKHSIFDMYKRLLSKLLVDLPEDPLQYIHDKLKQDDGEVPQVAVLGPPVSGKWCIAHKVSTLINAPHLSPEKLVQDAPKELLTEINKYQQNHEEIPDELWVRVLSERLSRYDCTRKGWVLDGFPETENQAKALQAVGIMPRHVVVLEASDSLLLERSEGKRIDPETGEVYHTIFDYPSEITTQDRLTKPDDYTPEHIVARLLLYHRHIGDILNAYRTVYKTINSDQPKTDVFAQVEGFVSQEPRSVAPSCPRIILLGPTGSGKAVQAALIAAKYNVVNLSVPHLIQQAIESESKLGLAIKPYVNQDITDYATLNFGNANQKSEVDDTSTYTTFVPNYAYKGPKKCPRPMFLKDIVDKIPDNLVLAVIGERLAQLDCLTRGWVLHGFPKSVDQAASLDQDGFRPNRRVSLFRPTRVFFLDVPNDIVLERLTLRATDPITGEKYHMLYNPPRSMEVKDRLTQHPRDSEEQVRGRLGSYYAHQEDLQDYYASAQRVNADQDPHTVFEYIESTIVNPLPINFEKLN